MISAPKTVLVVDDEPAVRWLLQQALPAHLPDFAVATVANGQEAIDYLSTYPVEVVVTDINMPVKDGFELLAHVRNHLPNLPVVVLASTAPDDVTERFPRLGALHVLQKPAAPEAVARHVLEARSESVRGRMSGVPLAPLLQLMQLERKSCALLVRSGERKGRLHFLSGELVDAYAFEFDVTGETAARHLLGLDKVTIDFERSLHNHVRRIHTPLETLLLEVATLQDEANHREASLGTARQAAAPEAAAPEAGPPEATAPDVGAREPAEAAPGTRSLEASVERLRLAMVGLRARSGFAADRLDASASDLARAIEVLAGTAGPLPTGVPSDDRLFATWTEVSELATRLVRAADALGARREGVA